MNKPKFETTNLTAENVTKIAEIFPGVVTEGKVNFDLLRSLLGDEVYGRQRAGRPAAARAAGGACRANPVPLFLPCHRVMAANGQWGGFSAGLPWKIHLLRLEGVGS